MRANWSNALDLRGKARQLGVVWSPTCLGSDRTCANPLSRSKASVFFFTWACLKIKEPTKRGPRQIHTHMILATHITSSTWALSFRVPHCSPIIYALLDRIRPVGVGRKISRSVLIPGVSTRSGTPGEE